MFKDFSPFDFYSLPNLGAFLKIIKGNLKVFCINEYMYLCILYVVLGERAASKVFLFIAVLLVGLFANHFRKGILHSSLEQKLSCYKLLCFCVWFCFKFLKPKWWFNIVSLFFPFLKASTQKYSCLKVKWNQGSALEKIFFFFLMQWSVSITDHNHI